MTRRGGGGELQEEEKTRGIIRFREEEISRLKVFVLNEAAQFVIWQLRLHLICNWNWCTAPSVNISEEETNSEGSEVNYWQLTGPDTGSNIMGGGVDIDADELWSKKSRLWRLLSWRLNCMSCCVFPLGLGATAATARTGCPCKTGWICVPFRDCRRRKKSCLFRGRCRQTSRRSCLWKPESSAAFSYLNYVNQHATVMRHDRWNFP